MTTEFELRNWRYGSIQAERLCAQILLAEGFKDVDPQSPLGGPDGRKDIVCLKEGRRYIAACFFPPTAQSFPEIRKKFRHDLKGVQENSAEGFVFLVNQTVTPSQRKILFADALKTGCSKLEVFHLERIRVILDSAPNEGLREEYLRIPSSRAARLNIDDTVV